MLNIEFPNVWETYIDLFHERKARIRMSNTLSVRVASRKSDAGDYYEGTVSIAGLKPTKLARRSDGSTQFPTKSAVSGAARNLAKSLGFTDVDVSDTASKTATPATATLKKAAKKSSVSKKVTSVKAPAKSKSSTASTTTQS